MKSAKHLLSLGITLGAVGLASCSTPKPECQAAASNVNGAGLSGLAAFAVRLTPTGGSGPCAELKGEVIGMQTYHPPSADDPKVRDLTRTSVAIRTQSHGELFWMNEDFGYAVAKDPTLDFNDPTQCVAPEDNPPRSCTDASECCGFPSAECNGGTCVPFSPNAIGEFPVIEPDSNDFCTLPTVAESRQVFPGGIIPIDTEVACMTDAECDPMAMGPGGVCTPLDPMDPMAGSTCVIDDVYEPTDITYRWSNVQFYVTAAATGTQFMADLEVVLNGCTATYRAVGMWPAVDCTNFVTGEPDVAMCHPVADPNNKDLPRLYGSGINPDFGPVVCDPNFGPISVVDQYYGGGLNVPRCVLDTDAVPALEGFPELTPAP